MADLTAQDIVVSILNGDHTPSELVEIGQAITASMEQKDAVERWWVHLDGRYFTQQTANPAAAAFFEADTGIKWERANPVEMRQRVAIVVAHLIEVDDMSRAAAFEYLKPFSADDMTCGTYAVVNPPKVSAPSGT